jgi:hypothetical protein
VQRHDNRGARRGRGRVVGTVVLALVGVAVTMGAEGGCSSIGAANASDAKPTGGSSSHAASHASSSAAASTRDPACTTALEDVSHYGPSTVSLLADGRKSVAKAAVQLLVDGLDGAADAADTPQAKHAIQTLADAYMDYFDLTTDAVSIPLSTLLKDTSDFEFACR